MQQLGFGLQFLSTSIPDLDRFPSVGVIFPFRVPDFEFRDSNLSDLLVLPHSPLGAGYSISPGRHGQNRAWRVADHALRHAPAQRIDDALLTFGGHDDQIRLFGRT
jgi:hypothetical protein